MGTVSSLRLPKHIAIVMDGNGRWAGRKGLPRAAGHRSGVKTLRKLIEHAVSLQLNMVTVYAFSRENWQRPKQEVAFLMDLFTTSLQSEVIDLNKNNVRLSFIGERVAFSKKLQQSIDDSESLTSSNTGLRLNVAVNYSGRWDIVQACQSLFVDSIQSEIDESMIAERLSLADLPDPDLFIRTGGEKRISNYFLWQLAYTELYFTETLWSDFDIDQFDKALEWFSGRQRRFGKISEQVEE